MESIDWCLVSAWAAIPLHVKKLAVMVNGTTYAKKIEVEHKKQKQKYRYKKIKHRFLTFQAINKPFIKLLMLI